MARRELSEAQLAVVQATRAALADPASGSGGEPRGALRVGLSGGADSLALVAAIAHLVRRVMVPGDVEAVVVDHGLQNRSAQVAARAAAQAQALGLAARVVAVEVSGPGGVEAAARRARLDALTHDARAVLLGHTLDDQAETVLLGLGRGSGARSLQGMAAVAHWDGVPLLRPLLGLRRGTVRQACVDWGLEPWEDPMNSDPRFRRVRVRRELLPLADEVLGGGVVEALARTAEMARADADLLDELASRVPAARGDGLDVATLAAQPPALRTRVVRRWLVERGTSEPDHGRVHAVLALVDDWHGQRGVDLPGGVRVVREGGTLRARPAPGNQDG